ncbi:MAG: hypothetical protein Q9157_006172 [Trypethelium eluteriae]
MSRNICSASTRPLSVCPFGPTTASFSSVDSPYDPAPCNYAPINEILPPDEGPYDVVDSTTFWANKAYISLARVYASGSCGYVGAQHTSTILTLKSSDIYSVWGYHHDFIDAAYSYNFEDLNSPIPAAAYPYFGGGPCSAPLSEYSKWNWPNAVNNGEGDPCLTIVQDAVQQTLAVPPQLRSIDPQWAHCALDLLGLYDPPYALTQAGFAAAPVSSADPAPSSSAQPAPVPTPQPNSAPQTSTADPPSTQTNKPNSAKPVSSNEPARGSAPVPAPTSVLNSEDPKDSPPSSVNVGSIVPSILGGGDGGDSGASSQQGGSGNAKSEVASTPAPISMTTNGQSDDSNLGAITSRLEGGGDPNAASGSGLSTRPGPVFSGSDLGHASSDPGSNTNPSSGSNGDPGATRSGSDSDPSGDPISSLNPGSDEGDPLASGSGMGLGSGSNLGSGAPDPTDASADITASAPNPEASGSGGSFSTNSESSSPGSEPSDSRFIFSSRPVVSGGATSISAALDGSNGVIIEGSMYQPGQSATLRNTPISIGTDAIIVPGTNGAPAGTISILSAANGGSEIETTSSSSGRSGAIFYAGGIAYTATPLPGSNEAVSIGGKTISAGGAPATLLNGQIFSAAPSGIVILGGASAGSQASTVAYLDLAGSGPDTVAAVATGVIITAANGQSFTAQSSAGRITIDGHTLVPGGVAVTLPNSQVVSADASGLVVGTGTAAIAETYSSLPASSFSTTIADFSEAVVTLGGSAMTVSEMDNSGIAILNGHTLSPGGTAATIDGMIVSVENSGVVVGDARGRSTSVAYSAAVTSTSTTTPAGSVENSAGGSPVAQTTSGASELRHKVLGRALVLAFAGIVVIVFFS